MLGLVVAALALTVPGVCDALMHQPRPPWTFGVGLGYGRGAFDSPNARHDAYRNGAVPSIQFGRMLGQHFMVGASYEGWMIELGGTVSDSVAVKFRRSLQTFGFSVSAFPGSPNNATGGIYLRAGVGTGWAGTATNVVHEDEAQHNAPRIDEWGIGVTAGLGYEFWIASNFTTGLGFNLAYLDIGERIVEQGAFAGLLFNVALYF